MAPAIASFRHENSDWLRTSFDELKCIVDEVYLRVYPSLDIALDTRGARKEAERQRQLQIENEKKEQLLREAAAKDLAEKAEKERKEALINKQLSVLEEKRQKTLAQYKTRLEAELPNQSYWYWFVRTLLTFSVASAIFWVVGRILTGDRNFGDVSDGVFISAILVVTLFAALFAKDHYENKAKNSEPYKIILSECDAEIALIDKEKNNLR